MVRRLFGTIVTFGLALAISPGPAAGQARPAATAKTSTVSHTPDGQPDIQGFWGTHFFTGDLETGQDEPESLAIRGQGAPDPAKAVSVIVDPPDGKIPYQAWAQAKRLSIPMFRRGESSRGTFKSVRDLRPQTLCLVGAPRITLYGDFEVIQTPGYVIMAWEWSHGYRVIPLDPNRPHLPENVKLQMGDARGHWEGNTLVVDTTNINDWDWFDMTGTFHTSDMTMVERFTVTDAKSITYEATITDPKVFTRPWTMRVPFVKATREPGYERLEAACVEGEKGAEALLKNAQH